MGTITGISDLDPVRWSNSHWRSVKVDLRKPVDFELVFPEILETHRSFLKMLDLLDIWE